MPEPQIQYARTSDGVSIANTTTGEGPPVLYCPTQFISMQHLLTGVPLGAWHARLSARTRFTIFDHAGIGASQRDVTDFSAEAQLRSVEAVAAQLPDESFTLEGFGAGCVSAALYAARHPGRVRRLVCIYPTPSTLTASFAATILKDWSLGRRLLAGWAYPDSLPTQRWFGNAMRESLKPEVAAAYMEQFPRTELEHIFRDIPVPTLICVAGAGQDREDALGLASVVPDCRVARVELDEVAEAILEFMGIETAQVNSILEGEASGPPSSAAASGMKAILFTDIADSTALTERMGDAAFRSTARALDERMRAAITGADGSAVDGKLLGDGVMAVFTSAAQAIEAAQRCIKLSAESELRLHIGLHAGDAIHEGGNVYGGAVNVAARVCALSAPGEILVSSTMRELARTSAGASFEDRGEHALKGIEDAVRVFAVRTEGA